MRLPGCCRTALFLLFSFYQLLHAENLTIAVAANVRYAAEKIVQKFQDETGIPCRLVVASSGKLSAQIRNGAPFHLFLSADTSYPAALIRDNFAVPPLRIYAHGALIIWSKTAIDTAALDSLLNVPDIEIAIANPRTAPYGAAAQQAWANLFPKQSDRRFIYGSSISQVNQYIQTSVVDIGFTSKSTLYHFKEEERGCWKDVPSGLHLPLAQGAVLLASVSDLERKHAERFLHFLVGPQAIEILQTYGYRIE